MADEAEWVVVRAFDDPVEAEVVLNFLRDHGVTVALRGNSGATSVLNRFTTVLDIRLVVPPSELERAREVLDAMVPGEDELVREVPAAPQEGAHAAPYRGATLSESADEETRPRRHRAGPVVLALMPGFGAGHFYARHNRAGLVFAASIGSFLIAGLANGASALVLAALCVMLFDGVLGVAAVARYNEGRVAGDGAQTAYSLAVVVVALLIGVALSHAHPRHHRTAQDAPDGTRDALPARAY